MAELATQLPLVLITLPLIGAALILAGAARRGDRAQRLFQSNTWFTAIAAVVALALDQWSAATADGSSLTFGGRVRLWPALDLPLHVRPPVATFQLAADSLSLWIVAALALMFLAISSRPIARRGFRSPRELILLLLLQSALLLVFLAADLLLFAASVLAADWIFTAALGSGAGPERRTVAARFALTHAVADFALAAGCLATAISLLWIQTEIGNTDGSAASIPRLLRLLPEATSGNESAYRYWSAVSPGIFALLSLGMWIKSGLFPFHGWLSATLAAAPTGVGMVMAAMQPTVAFYVWFRFLLPLFPEMLPPWSTIGIWLGAAAAMHAALLIATQEDLFKVAAALTALQSSLVLVALATASLLGAAAGMLGWFTLLVAIPLFLLGTADLQDRFGTSDRNAYSGLWHLRPQAAIPLVAAAAILLGVPGTIGFARIWPLLLAVTEQSFVALGVLILGHGLLAWSLSAILFKLLFGPPRLPGDRLANETATATGAATLSGGDFAREWSTSFAAVPFVLLALVGGVAPMLIIGRVTGTISQPIERVEAARARITSAAASPLNARPPLKGTTVVAQPP